MTTKLITYRDLHDIVSNSKKNFSNQASPIHVSNKKAEYVDLLHIAMVESILMYLNGNGLLTESIKFDYTDVSNELESLD